MIFLFIFNVFSIDKAAILFTFDDGHSNIFENARNSMNRNGVKSTQFINGKFVNSKSYMTLEQLHTLQGEGHSISSHTWSHARLTSLSKDSIAFELKTNLDFLKSNDFTGTDIFAYPYGSVNDSVIDVVKHYHSFARTTNPKTYQGFPFKNPYLIATYEIFDTTKLRGVFDVIDSAIIKKSIVIFCFHNIVDTAYQRTAWSKVSFDSLCNYIGRKNALNELVTPNFKGFIEMVSTPVMLKAKQYRKVYSRTNPYYSLSGKRIKSKGFGIFVSRTRKIILSQDR